MPPPPKPTAPPAAPSLGGPADEADRLGREHSNKREMKMRQERVRALADEAPPSRRGPDAPRAVPAGAPVVQPRPPTGSSRIPDVDGPPPQRTPAAPRPAVERAPQNEKNVVERPIQSRGVVEKVIEPARAREAPAPSVIDDVGVEAEEFLRENGALWARFSVADKISFVSACLVLVGTLLPWLWRKNEEVVLGVGCGGVVHAALAVYAMWLLFDRERNAPSWSDDRGVRPTPHMMKKKARRTALWMLLLAMVSTFAGIWFFFVYGAIRRYEVPTVDISVGLYVTLAAGLGLSYSGFAYFWRGGRE